MAIISGRGGNDTITPAYVSPDTFGGTPSDAADEIRGGGGDDLIDGGGGNDNLNGGDGANTVIGGAGRDWLTSWSGLDRLEGGSDSDDYSLFAAAQVVELPFGGYDWVVIGYDNAVMPDHVERGTLDQFSPAITASGNAQNNDLSGNQLDNVLRGGEGDDSLHGGYSAGADTLAGDGGTDTLDGDGGADSLSGGAGTDRLLGGDGADSLNGGTEGDVMIGGPGDDVYFVGQVGDVVSEGGGGGTDTVRITSAYTEHYLLPDQVETLLLQGTEPLFATGNGLDNAITGNSAANVLSGLDGADTLDGAGDADSLMGGRGNDVYLVDHIGDALSEAGGDGEDRVEAAIAWTLGADVEHLTLAGGGAIAGTGNALANLILGNQAGNVLAGGGMADTLVGQAGNDVLNGGAGADSMAGGAGSDRYTVDHVGDVVIEDAVAGVDVVSAFVDWVLGDNLEQLNLLGTAVAGSGNGLANRIVGNAGDNLLVGLGGNDALLGGDGADTLVGGPGRDALTGGLGADRFLFNAPTDGVDRIADFAPGQDVLAMAAANFGGLPAGALAAANFVAHAANTATSAAGVPQFTYNTAAGVLFFDADGQGGAATVRLAVLTGAPALMAADIVLV